jgi:hypothetical protein
MASSRREIYAKQHRPMLGQMLGGDLRLPGAINIYLEVGYKKLYGFANPSREIDSNGLPLYHVIFWMGKEWATVIYDEAGWLSSVPVEQAVLDAVGDYLIAWYQ